MIPTLKYLWLTLKHKWFVLLAGLQTGAPIWLLVIHDWSKFTPSEAPHYGRQFFGKADDALGFSKAWNHHQKTNPHHWEYWVMVSGHDRGGFPDGSPLPMPEKYVREMVADWLGASRAYEGHWPKSLMEWKWFVTNISKINIHPDTYDLVMKIVSRVVPSYS